MLSVFPVFRSFQSYLCRWRHFWTFCVILKERTVYCCIYCRLAGLGPFLLGILLVAWRDPVSFFVAFKNLKLLAVDGFVCGRKLSSSRVVVNTCARE